MKFLPSKGMIIPMLLVAVAAIYIVNRVPAIKAKVA